MMIKEVWFDTSGTLYREDTEFEAAQSAYIYKQLSVVTGEADSEKMKALHDRLYEQHGSNSSVFQALGMPADYWQKKFEEFDTNALLEPNTEITETLRALKAVVPISVFTNLRAAKLKDMLGYLEIPLDFFTHVLSAVDVGKLKPDPAGFHKMVELSGAKPGETLYVGDKVGKDIRPAKQVGMVTCLVWSESPEADFCIASFPEILSIVSSSMTQ
jgi:HAD superfamily hydrolase (TIGR01509 family)